VLFDTTYSILVSGKPIKEVEPLSTDTYRPGGNTALNDALAQAIIETGKRLESTPESDRPDKVICVVITDGQENSSKEHTKSQVQEMIKHQEEKYDWAFMYLGTGVDAFDEALQLGIQSSMAADFSGGSIGIRSAYVGTSEAVKGYRGGGKSGLAQVDWKGKVKN
jgi:Mg-chelatase subunit ChlD